jgi:hypothetical protein
MEKGLLNVWVHFQSLNSPISHCVDGELWILPGINRSFSAHIISFEDFLSLLGCSIYQIRIHFGFFTSRVSILSN